MAYIKRSTIKKKLASGKFETYHYYSLATSYRRKDGTPTSKIIKHLGKLENLSPEYRKLYESRRRKKS